MSNNKMLVTLRVLVEASSSDRAFQLIEESLSSSIVDGSEVEMLACVEADHNICTANTSALEEAMSNTPVAIPFGLDYQLVGSREGGTCGGSCGIDSAWVGIKAAPSVWVWEGAEQPAGEMSLYIRRTDDVSVAIDITAAHADKVLSSASALFSDASQEQIGGAA